MVGSQPGLGNPSCPEADVFIPHFQFSGKCGMTFWFNAFVMRNSRVALAKDIES